MRCLLVSVVLLAAPVGAQSMPQGVMVGSLTGDSAMVWTRLDRPGHVAVRYGTDPTLVTFQQTAAVASDSSRVDIAKVRLTGLVPATRYHYALRVSAQPGGVGTLSPVGTFRTPPAAGSHGAVTMTFSGDIKWDVDKSLFGDMASLQPDLYLHLGDMPYADGATTVAEYHQKHLRVRGDAAMHPFLRSVATLAIWDDHEVVNNWDANTSPTLVANGIRAFRDMFPLDDGLTDFWRSRRWGDTVEVFALDTRSRRGVNAAPDLPARPILGTAQMSWIQQALLASAALFKVVMTSGPLNYTAGSDDTWESYRHPRDRLLGFIARHRIPGVVFVSADRHWPAAQHHRTGVREYVAGPVAQFTQAPSPLADPELRWDSKGLNFGWLEVDPNAVPPRLTVRHYGAGPTLLHEEVFELGDPCALEVATDDARAAWKLADGPFYARDSGHRSRREALEPGSYRLLFGDPRDGDGAPAALPLTLPPGGEVRVAADVRDIAHPVHPVLFHADFAGDLGGWSVVDQGTVSGPASWYTSEGYLIQKSNVHDPVLPAAKGTMAVTGDPGWTDYTCSVRLRPQDNDGIGVVFRYVDADNHYRFSMDHQRGYRRLARVENGAVTILDSDTGGYVRNRWHRVSVVAVGSTLRVVVDGQEWLRASDGRFPAGAVGLYTWANQSNMFDELVVRRGDATGTGRTAHLVDDFGDGVLTGYTVVDLPGTGGGPSQWVESGGVLTQTTNIGGGSFATPARPGTVALASPVLGDFDLRVGLRSPDNDGIGVVFRYVDPANHYRFAMNAQHGQRRLSVVRGGQWTVLWEDDDHGYVPEAWEHLAVSGRGDHLLVSLDGFPVCAVRDASHAQGRCGLYSWFNTGATFDNLRLQEPGPRRAVTASVTPANATATDLRVEAPASAGMPYVLALALGTDPGQPLSAFRPGDPRTLALNPDFLFQASLAPSPFLVGFQGTLGAAGSANASVVYPSVPVVGFSGTEVFAGGVVLDPGGGGFGEVLPAVSFVVP